MPPNRPCRRCRRLHRSPRELCPECQLLADAETATRRLEDEPWRWVFKDARWDHARFACLRRDDYRCRAVTLDGSRCPVEAGLQAHHTIPLAELYRLGDMHAAFRVDLLVTLCPRCHNRAERALNR